MKLLAALLWVGSYVALGGSPAQAADSAEACAQAVRLFETGDLKDATSVSAAVGGDCEAQIGGLVKGAQSAAQTLADSAKDAVPAKEKERLARLALSLDDANKLAQEVLDSLTPAQDASRCAEADQAIKDGEFARAQALYDALKDDDAAKPCRTKGAAKLAQALEARWPTRVQHFVVDDGLTTWLVALVAFAIGVVAAGFLRFPAPLRGAGALAGLIALGVVVWQWRQPLPWWSAPWNAPIYAVLVILSAFAGLVLSNAVRTRAPVRITMTGDGQTVLAAEVIAELHALGESGARGIYAPADTDVTASGVTGALEQVSNPVVKAVLAVWRAIQLGAGDRVEIACVAKEKTPSSATLMLYAGRALVLTTSVDGAQFCSDPAKPTEAELATSARDVATGVAAAILLSRLELGGAPGKDAATAKVRLYGATEAIGVALAAVAARRLGSGNAPSAMVLYSRAVDKDPANRSARFGRIATALRTYPSGRTAQHLIAELKQLYTEEQESSPLTWRMAYALAAATANSVLAGEKPERGLLKRPHVVAAFAGAREQLEALPHDFVAGGAVLESDRELWNRLREMADVASLGLQPDDVQQPVENRPSERLIHATLTVPPAVLHNVACGLALAYARTRRESRGRRRRLAEACVDRLRLAGQSPDRRAALLGDPCLGFVAATAQFVALKKEWGLVRDDPYAEVDAIGELSGKIAESYPRPRDLAMALATADGRTTAIRTFGVDATTVGRWAGAAVWLAAGQPANRVNLYHASGYPDAPAAAAEDDSVVQEHLKATAKVTGVKGLPTQAERAAMAQPGP